MDTFTDTELDQIRWSAYQIASEEISMQRISDPERELVSELAAYLFEHRTDWASFDESADQEAYVPVIARFFGEEADQ